MNRSNSQCSVIPKQSKRIVVDEGGMLHFHSDCVSFHEFPFQTTKTVAVGKRGTFSTGKRGESYTVSSSRSIEQSCASSYSTGHAKNEASLRSLQQMGVEIVRERSDDSLGPSQDNNERNQQNRETICHRWRVREMDVW